MSKASLHEKLEAGIKKILAQYPDGKSYDRYELISDVTRDLIVLMHELRIRRDTPFEVYVDDGILTIKFGRFPNLN